MAAGDEKKPPMPEGEGEDRLERSKEIYRNFLERRESGEALTPDQVIGRYPELEEELRRLFEELKEAGGYAAPKPPAALGDFRIIREIGSGGMGTVYEAEQVTMKRRVALKVLPSHLSFSDEAVRKFRREAEAGGRSNHPGIVTIHGVGEEQGVHYIAQELVEGGITLADRLREIRADGLQPPGYFREAARLVEEVAEALQHAHEAGVIHRDIKPSNILLTSDGRPKVTDFGLARVEDALALSRTGELSGTPYYMSPEQAASRRIGIDRRTDIFSLGVTLYELLTMERPFQGKTSQEVLKKILLHEPRDPRKINPRVPRDLAVICLKAMEKKPEARYGSMEELSYDLLRYLAGDVIQARPPGFGARLLRRVKRNPAVSLAGGAALVAVTALLAYILWSYPVIVAEKRKARQEAERARAAEEKASRERDEKETALVELKKELVRSDGLRLAALSMGLRDTRPGAALRLAMESARRSPGLEASNAVLDALDRCHERAILCPSFGFDPHSVAFDKDGQSILIATSGPEACIWDLKTGKKAVVFEGHTKEIHSAVFSKDFEKVLTASADRTARLWDAKTGKELLCFEGHEKAVESAVFSPDGGKVLTASEDGTARIFDAGTGEELSSLKTGAIRRAVFSPDGTSILTMDGGRKSFQVFETATGKRRFKEGVIAPLITSAVFSPDGVELLMTRTDKTAALLVAETGVKRLVLEGHEDEVNRGAFSPDGRKVVTASDDGTARIWNRATGRLLRILEGHEGRVSGAVFSPDGTRVLTFSKEDRTARVFDAETGKPLAVFRGHEGSINGAAFSPDGRRVATASMDRTVRLWSLEACHPWVRFGSRESPVRSAAFMPGGEEVLLVGEDGGARICAASSERVDLEIVTRTETAPADPEAYAAKILQVNGPEGGIKCAASSPDGKRLIAVSKQGKNAWVLDIEKAEVLCAIDAGWGMNYYNAGVFSPDGERVLLAGGTRVAWTHDSATGKKLATFMGHKQVLLNIFNYFRASFSPDGRKVLTSSSDCTARLWDGETGEELLAVPGDTAAVTSSFFSPDGEKIATLGWDLHLRVWDASSGKEIFSDWGFGGASPFHPDGRRIATASPFNDSIQILDLDTKEVLHTMWGHTDRIQTCVFSPDGRRFLSASDDGTARVWDTETGDETLTFRGHWGKLKSAAFSPDGSKALSLGEDGTANLWPVDPLVVAVANPPRKLLLMEKRKYHVWEKGEEKSLPLMDRLFRVFSPSGKLIDAIENDPNLTDDVRSEALDMVRSISARKTMLEARTSR